MNGSALRCLCHDVTFTTLSAYLDAHPGAMNRSEQLDELELGEAVERHPAGRHYVGTFEDGSQVLVEEHVPGKLTAAVRSASWQTWSAPTFLDDAP